MLDASISSIREILLSAFPVAVSFIYFLVDTEVEQRNEYEEMVSSMKRDLFLIVEQRQWPHRNVCTAKNYFTILRNILQSSSSWMTCIYVTFRINKFFFSFILALWELWNVIYHYLWIYKICDATPFFKIFKRINFFTCVKRLNLVIKKLEIALTKY